MTMAESDSEPPQISLGTAENDQAIANHAAAQQRQRDPGMVFAVEGLIRVELRVIVFPFVQLATFLLTIEAALVLMVLSVSPEVAVWIGWFNLVFICVSAFILKYGQRLGWIP